MNAGLTPTPQVSIHTAKVCVRQVLRVEASWQDLDGGEASGQVYLSLMLLYNNTCSVIDLSW